MFSVALYPVNRFDAPLLSNKCNTSAEDVIVEADAILLMSFSCGVSPPLRCGIKPSLPTMVADPSTHFSPSQV
jgi:hypothetical protein